jgi:hypothetical protein
MEDGRMEDGRMEDVRMEDGRMEDRRMEEHTKTKASSLKNFINTLSCMLFLPFNLDKKAYFQDELFAKTIFCTNFCRQGKTTMISLNFAAFRLVPFFT